jgi:hydrogenase nickel incorporation protein HypA/HybF
MHEWALAESIIVAALNAAEKDKLKKINEIVIQIGELQQIEKDIFDYALKEIIKLQNKKLKNTKIRIETEKGKLNCNNCKYTWYFSEMKEKLAEGERESIHFIPEVALVYARCPKCGSPDFEIVKGRGISIKSIKGVR